VSKWLQVAAYAVPVASIVFQKCRRMGLSPALPLLGLLAGILLEVQRD
jgi:hypothetical protein